MSRVTGAAPMGYSSPTASHLYFTFLQCTIIYEAYLPFFVTARFCLLQLGTEASVFTSSSSPTQKLASLPSKLVRLATALSGKLSPHQASRWLAPFSMSPSSATQPCAVATSDQLPAIEAVQPTPPCRGAIQGLLPSVLGVS